MMNLRKLITSSDFLRNNGIFFVGSFAVSVLNYLFYPVLGRLLPPTQFGEVQTLVSLFLQINIFLGVLTNVAVNVVTNERDESVRNKTVLVIERLATLVTLAVALIGLLFIGQTRSFLKFNDNMPFVVLGLSVILSAPLALQTAYLRGRSAFGTLSINNITASVMKLLASVVFVLAGYGTAGAIGGLVAGQLVSLWFARISTRKLGLKRPAGLNRFGWPDLTLIKPQLGYTGLVLIVSLVTTYLFSVDIIVVKHYFDAETAGLYAGIATIGRIIYYLTGSVSIVLLSSIKLESAPKTNRALLVRSGLLHLALGGSTLVLFTLAPQWVIRTLIGAKYLTYSNLLPRLGLALLIIATVNLIFSYDMALRRTSAAVVAVIGAVITIGVVAVHHGTPGQVVTSILVGGAAMLVVRCFDSLRRSIQLRS
jgi:O-antigen/teichoic acid export membrane protein